MLYLSKLESKLDEALSKETRESLTEWIGHKRNKPLNHNKMGYSEKGAATSTLWAIVNEQDEILFSRGGSSSTPKLMVYADETSAKRGLRNTWSKQHIADNKYQIKLIYNI